VTDSLSGKNENQRWNLAGIQSGTGKETQSGTENLEQEKYLAKKTKTQVAKNRDRERAPGTLLTQRFHTKKNKQRTQ
jgi:hypothetical protein